MSTKSEPDDTASQIDVESSGSVREALEPRLDFKSGGAGYVRAEALLEDDGGFETPETELPFYDDLARDSIVLGPERATTVLEGYFGQYSFSGDLEEHVEAMMGDDYAGSGFLPDARELDGALLLRVDTMEYDGRQHIDYHGSKVSEELIGLVEEEATGEDVDVHYVEGEDSDSLLIRSSP